MAKKNRAPAGVALIRAAIPALQELADAYHLAGHRERQQMRCSPGSERYKDLEIEIRALRSHGVEMRDLISRALFFALGAGSDAGLVPGRSDREDAEVRQAGGEAEAAVPSVVEGMTDGEISMADEKPAGGLRERVAEIKADPRFGELEAEAVAAYRRGLAVFELIEAEFPISGMRWELRGGERGGYVVLPRHVGCDDVDGDG